MSDRTRANFEGLRVAAFESRRAAEMIRLLEHAGAVAFVSPAMREVALGENRPLLDFARGLIAGRFDIVVLMTGVGFRLLLRALQSEVDESSFVEALGRVTTVARGPKPVAAMHEVGLTPTVKIGEPNTWRDILAACKAGRPDVRGARIAIQEHGQPSSELRAGLESLRASVTSVSVYQWAFPEDTAPLEANLRRIAAGQVDAALFTSSRQVVHMLQMATRLGLEEQVRAGLGRIVVGSIGPSTSETLREYGIGADFGPEHPRLGHLVAEAASAVPRLLPSKQAPAASSS